MAGDHVPPSGAATFSRLILGDSDPAALRVETVSEGRWRVYWAGHGSWEYDRVYSMVWRDNMPIYLAKNGPRFLVMVGAAQHLSFDEPAEGIEVRRVNDELEIALLRDGKPFFTFRIPFNPLL
jgi:hypothetical protein